MIKKLFVTLVSVFAFTSTLSFSAKAEINFLIGNWAEEPLKPYIEEFTAATGIKVNVQAFPFSDLLSTIEVRGNAKADDVDVIFADAPLVPSYAVRGMLAPMDGYFSDTNVAEIFAPAGIAAASWDGSMYAPPLNNSGQLTYYNKDLLNKAGCSFHTMDESGRMTWEELVSCAQKINDPDNGIYGFIFDQISRYYQLQSLPESAGGGSGVCDGGLSVKGCLTNDGWIKAGQFYHDIHNSLGISPQGVGPDQTHAMFGEGKIGFFVGGSWNNGRWKDTELNYGVALHPYFEGGKVVTGCNSWHIGLWNHSKQKDDAAKFVRYLTASPKVALGYVEDYGQVPAHNSAILHVSEDPKFNNFPDIVMKLASYESANHCATRGRTPGFLEFEEIVNTSFEDIRNGGDPASVLGSAESRIESSMRRYQ